MSEPTPTLRVALVHPSAAVRRALAAALGPEAGFALAGEADNGADAVGLARAGGVGVLVTGLDLPLIDGVAATRAILRAAPVPVLVLGPPAPARGRTAPIDALAAGAVDALPLAAGDEAEAVAAAAAELRARVRACAGARVLPRRPEADPTPLPPEASRPARATLAAVASGLGAVPTLAGLLRCLPPRVSAPLLVVQDLAPALLPALAEWLHRELDRPVKLAEHGERPRPGIVYLAPGHRHLRAEAGPRLALEDSDPHGGRRPSADVLLRTMAEHGADHAVALLLGGRGADGVEGLAALREAGALTLAEAAATRVYDEAPARAADAQAAVAVLDAAGLARALAEAVDLGGA